MTDPILCLCGEPLAQSVTEEGVVLPDGELVPFRRQTDYVICPHCLRMYRATDLLQGRVVAVEEEDDRTPGVPEDEEGED